MFKERPEILEFGTAGTIVGVVAFLRAFAVNHTGLGYLLLFSGLLIGVLLGYWLHGKSQYMKTFVRYALVGIIVGMIAGGTEFKMGETGAVIGAGIGMLFSAVVIGGFVNLMRSWDKYLSYRGETLWILLLGLFGAFTGASLAPILLDNRIGKLFKDMIDPTTLGFILIVVLSLVLTIIIGLIVSSNRFRPALGGCLVLMGGGLVTWVGINMAPILFLPGSGLYWAGMIMGLVILAAGIAAFAFPQSHIAVGVVAMVFSILSYIGAAGGLIIGGVLGIVGGALIVGWESPQERNRWTQGEEDGAFLNESKTNGFIEQNREDNSMQASSMTTPRGVSAAENIQ